MHQYFILVLVSILTDLKYSLQPQMKIVFFISVSHQTCRPQNDIVGTELAEIEHMLPNPMVRSTHRKYHPHISEPLQKDFFQQYFYLGSRPIAGIRAKMEHERTYIQTYKMARETHNKLYAGSFFRVKHNIMNQHPANPGSPHSVKPLFRH